MYEDTTEAPLRCSSISLEDGADESYMGGEPLGFCEDGMCFPSRWHFEEGTTLALTLELCGPESRARVEGIVVACDKVGDRLWCVTVIFLDVPKGLSLLRPAHNRVVL